MNANTSGKPADARKSTQPETDQGAQRPRLPHEHDESADSQSSAPREVMRQAHEDIESGQEDTDLRGSRGKRETTVPSSRENK
ncbi:hypothetical protein FOZ76_03535 [Verticiella sediminum]|uniref:Uncharacterized protein n=1 Tax=Verticiella sediminum TaxID=1247510 RepID=A0A556AYA5_9BURK|nr:hypothetical protein [Verticiella sediminum]TSH97876.1 hypothetical protein FOZ76_03535 [Verticiella sediminum]